MDVLKSYLKADAALVLQPTGGARQPNVTHASVALPAYDVPPLWWVY